MWFKFRYRLRSPVLRPPIPSPADGTLMFYAKTDDLPIKKHYLPDGRWFYRVSIWFFEGKPIEKKVFIRRQSSGSYLYYTSLAAGKKRRVPSDGTGPFRAIQKAYLFVFTPYVFFLADVEEGKEEEMEEIAKKVEGIGKKVNAGWGWVEYEGAEDLSLEGESILEEGTENEVLKELESYRYRGKLIRHLPEEVAGTATGYANLIPPYWKPNESWSRVLHAVDCRVEEIEDGVEEPERVA